MLRGPLSPFLLAYYPIRTSVLGSARVVTTVLRRAWPLSFQANVYNGHGAAEGRMHHADADVSADPSQPASSSPATSIITAGLPFSYDLLAK